MTGSKKVTIQRNFLFANQGVIGGAQPREAHLSRLMRLLTSAHPMGLLLVTKKYHLQPIPCKNHRYLFYILKQDYEY